MTSRRLHPRRRGRRGNFMLLLAFSIMVVLGFGAIAIDYGYLLATRAEAQDVADAAARSGLVVLRQTGDQDEARRAARRVVALNHVAGEEPELLGLQFGTWDDSLVNPSFVRNSVRPNAVQAEVGRIDNRVDYFLARLWGTEDFEVSQTAVSATRSTQIAVVLDITGSWEEGPFIDARNAVVAVAELVQRTANGVDELGMSVFTNRYAWEFTPFTRMADDAAAAAVIAQWSEVNIASKAGTDADPRDGVGCALNSSPNQNNFDAPAGGCYPNMPREYRDERGTDHSTGVLLAKDMFEARATGVRYRGMIVLTDGRPNALLSRSGTARGTAGYTEDRWTEYLGPVPRTRQEIRDATIQATQDLWDAQRVHTWVVSFIKHDDMMPAMAQGDGYYVLTRDSRELENILTQILTEMPLALVE